MKKPKERQRIEIALREEVIKHLDNEAKKMNNSRKGYIEYLCVREYYNAKYPDVNSNNNEQL